ncbi:MAG: carboxypeptidase regulatory-like domain-containing protein [Myxococcota bacterium]
MKATAMVLVVTWCSAGVGAAQELALDAGLSPASVEDARDAGFLPGVPSATLSGIVLTRGTRDVVVLAQVSLEDGGVQLAESGPDGGFQLDLAPGEVRLRISASGHRPRVIERLKAHERVEVLYRLGRPSTQSAHPVGLRA